MVVLLVATPLFYYLPQAVLAAVVMSAIYSLVDYAIIPVLWRQSRRDLVSLLATFFATVVLGVEIGIIIAVITSLLVTLAKAAAPGTSVLARAPGTVLYRDVRRTKGAVVVPGVLVFRFDGQVFFGNAQYLRDQLKAAEIEMKAC
jgi:SulP family sulfate permease